ncbi:SDR family oxidoreductase [Paucidesulfovibrio longus]|uniref:SDR family oxidoreductase n=1 Tax=Paucidesulfovibrio longus TaxID=889 RepID=UPI001B7F9E7A|nr:SDR family oxidoreductase [Paucidesulfovibrio longus]
MVLVAGASGYLGGHVVRELHRQGYRVRVLVRTPEQADLLREVSDERVVAEVTRPETLQGVCDGVDWIFSSVGITRQKDGLTYMDVDYRGNRNLLDEALRAGAKRFLYVSVLHGDRLRHLAITAAKERFVEELRAAPIQGCVVRPTGFFSDMDDLLRLAGCGRVWLFGDGSFRANPVHGSDLAEACVRQLRDAEPERTVGGPEVLRHDEMAGAAFAALGKPVRISFLPLWLVPPLLWLLRRLTPLSVYGPLEFFLTVFSRDMVAPTFGSWTLAAHYRERAATLGREAS